MTGIVAFTVPGQGHRNRMLPVVAGLCELGIRVDFFDHESGRGRVEETGARFVDLYAKRDMDFPDGSSRPVPMRNVGFAGYWGEDVAREVAALRPGLILHDTFAVIGRVVAFHLGLPRVNMRAGHNLEPKRALAELQAANVIEVSGACLASVEALRARHGIIDASPFSYFIDDKADLNICSEPPEFLLPEERGPFEPLAFFGSYWRGARVSDVPAEELFGPGCESCLRVYVALGTAAQMMLPEHVTALLGVMADGMAAYPNVRGLISLGSAHYPSEHISMLHRPNVRVVNFVDQIAALRNASIFVTHNGLNSTHEAIFHRVPMISCPLFGDQPGLAARCQALGLAVPLGPPPGAIPTVADVRAALDRVRAEYDAICERLAVARDWEVAVMERRPEVLRRIVSMIATDPPRAAMR
jgi:MGT family glycosyltransferase